MDLAVGMSVVDASALSQEHAAECEPITPRNVLSRMRGSTWRDSLQMPAGTQQARSFIRMRLLKHEGNKEVWTHTPCCVLP